MLYPRVTDDGTLVTEDSMVGWREHFIRRYRIIYLTGILAGDTDALVFLKALDSIPPHEPIKIFIRSPGGDLDTTFLLYDTIKLIQSPVITIGEYCASAAAILLAAGSKRYVLSHCKTMLHLPSNFFAKDTSIPFQDMEIIQQQARTYKEKMIDILIRCGVKKGHDEILQDIDREMWLEPQQAIDYGLCDAILTPDVWQEFVKEEEVLNTK